MKKGVESYKPKKRIRRKGVHAKSKSSRLKSYKNYKKPYRGQGNKR